LVVAGVLLLLAAVTARMLLGARAELSLATRASDSDARVRHLRRAMAYYLPANPWVDRAHDRLLALARRAERDGDHARALHAYRELRGAILSLRGATSPYSDTLPAVNTAIAILAVEDRRAADHLRASSAAGRLLSRLESPPDPHPVWAALGLAGFLVWVGAALALLFQGLRPDLTVVPRRFWPLLGLVVVGLGLFVAGMGLA
jgi:hypothetical protein